MHCGIRSSELRLQEKFRDAVQGIEDQGDSDDQASSEKLGQESQQALFDIQHKYSPPQERADDCGEPVRRTCPVVVSEYPLRAVHT
ncbi:unnamed protein product [Haemonchus placei]|uniref:GAGE domain-containing protein n=1 Tax=Haemonchus placei TaxID=6290 RepID=A0A0N4W1R5_HAEPC|nr:unnamed protein product [Haemonchus placei]